MPGETTDTRDQKKQMIEQWQSGRYSKGELARRFGVSRTTVYEWIGRFSACGCGGLAERSRAPRSQPHKTVARRGRADRGAAAGNVQDLSIKVFRMYSA